MPRQLKHTSYDVHILSVVLTLLGKRIINYFLKYVCTLLRNFWGKKKRERKEDPETALSVLRGARRGGGGWWGWGGRRPVDSVQGKGLKMLILCPQTQPLKDRSLSLDSSRNSRAEIKIDRWPRISLSNREALKCCCPFFCLKNYKPAFLFFTLGTLEDSRIGGWGMEIWQISV